MDNDKKDLMDNDKKEFSSKDIFWYKHKNKIIAGGATIAIALIAAGAIFFISTMNNGNTQDDTEFVGDEQRIADYLITPTKDKVILSMAEKEQSESSYTYKNVDELDTNDKTIYSNSNDLDSLYAFDKTTKKISQYKVDNANLAKNDVADYKGDVTDFKSFKYHDNVFAGYSNGYITVQYKDKVEVIKVDGDVANYLIKDNRVLYAIKNKLYAYNVETKKTQSVDLEKDIQDIELINNQVVAMSKFGETNKTSTIASFKVADLYATGLTTVNYTDTVALQNSDENVDFYVFSKDNQKNGITTVTISDEILKVEKTGGTFDAITEQDVGRNGYAYLIKNNKISVIDVNSGIEAGLLNIDDALLVAPVFY